MTCKLCKSANNMADRTIQFIEGRPVIVGQQTSAI